MHSQCKQTLVPSSYGRKGSKDGERLVKYYHMMIDIGCMPLPSLYMYNWRAERANLVVQLARFFYIYIYIIYNIIIIILGDECSAFLASGSDPTDDSRMKHIDFSSPGL